MAFSDHPGSAGFANTRFSFEAKAEFTKPKKPEAEAILMGFERLFWENPK
jgi:hypothetical protein